MATTSDSEFGHIEPLADVPCNHDMLAGTLRSGRKPVTLQLINPEGLPVPSTCTHIVVATGTTMVFIAGQEPEDAHGNLVGAADLAAEARQVFANLGRALAAAGARPDR